MFSQADNERPALVNALDVKIKSNGNDPGSGHNERDNGLSLSCSSVRGTPRVIMCQLIKLIYGYLFGSLLWHIVLQPYKHYYDFTFGYYWFEFVFSLLVSLIFVASLTARCTMVLFLPNMVGGATQNYIIVMLFTTLLANPLTSVGLNSVESVRVIGCSLTLTFDQLSERAKLVLNPIIEILEDRDQSDLDPIRQDLVRIQQYVSEIRQNAHLVAANSSARSQFNMPLDFFSAPPPSASSTQKLIQANGATTLSPNITSKPRLIATTRRDEHGAKTLVSKTGIDLEWDPANFGVRANVDMQKLRQLAKTGKLRDYLGKTLGKETNLTDILYNSCINVFHQAKKECVDSVEGLFQSCKKTIGPLLASWWCAPFSYSLESFCPWIMNQLVDETSLCKQVKIVNITAPSQVRLVSNNRDLNVDGAFQELNRQITHLNEDLLLDGGSGDQQLNQQLRRTQRLEIHLTFNEKTRQVFQATKSVIDFISDKYKMRRLLLDSLMFIYDAYTTYTFLLIMLQAWRYRRNYLTNIKYDNCYITRSFQELDKRYKQKHSNLATDLINNTNNNNNNNNEINNNIGNNYVDETNTRASSGVLPLTEDESEQYITTFTCRRRTHEERQVHRLTCSLVIVFLAFTLSLFYLDDIFYSLLASIQDHSLIRYKELGHHELDVRVRGEGVIARLVKRLVRHLNSVYNLDRYTSTRSCLPVARSTSNRFYLEFAGLVVAYFLINQIGIYAMRLRRPTCAYFYPKQERQRVQFLHKFILYQRHRLAASGLKDYLAKSDAESKDYGVYDDDNNKAVDTNVYSLKDALVYLKNCVSKSACKCRCFRCLFASSPSTTTRQSRKKIDVKA